MNEYSMKDTCVEQKWSMPLCREEQKRVPPGGIGEQGSGEVSMDIGTKAIVCAAVGQQSR